MTNVKFTGILLSTIEDDIVEQISKLKEKLPTDAICLKREDLHITLVNQKLLKPIKQYINNFKFNEAPKPILEDRVVEVTRSGRKSWIIPLKNQDDYLHYISTIRMKLLDEGVVLSYEDRVFHISIANLSGSPFSSVGDVKWEDVYNEHDDKLVDNNKNENKCQKIA